MKTFAMILLVVGAGAATACESNPATDTTHTTSATATQPDNTKTNTRDRSPSVTPIDQGNNQADLDVTQAIRKALMADDALSMNAKNVKVVTGKGVITLRGPVKTDAEKQSVEAKANAAAGSNRVDDQIDVQAN